MPGYAPLAPIPFAGRRDSRVTDILMQQGQQRAEAARAGGDIWGRAIQGVGNAVAGGIDAYQSGLAQKAKAQFEAQKAEREAQKEEREFGLKREELDLKAEAARRDADADREKIRADKLAFETNKNNYFARQLDRIEPFMSGPDGGAGAFKEAVQHSAEFLGPDEVEKLLQTPPEQYGQVFESIRQASPEWQERQKAKAEAEGKAGQQKFENDLATRKADDARRHDFATEAQARASAGGSGAVTLEPKKVMDDEGNVVLANYNPKTGQYVKPNGEPIKNPRDASDLTNRPPGKMNQAGPVVDAIDELSKKINTGSGPLATITGKLKQIAAGKNLDNDVAEYESIVSGFTPMIARALGHTGVLTEQDVQSVKALFPRPNDEEALRTRKVARIRDLMSKMEAQGGTAPAPTNSPKSDPLGLF